LKNKEEDERTERNQTEKDLKEKKRTEEETEAIHTEKKKKKNCWRTTTLFGRRITSTTASTTTRSVAPLPASSFSYSHALFAPVTTVLQSEQWRVFLLFTGPDWPHSKCTGPGTT
jgi:hypothetical protein